MAKLFQANYFVVEKPKGIWVKINRPNLKIVENNNQRKFGIG